jgi:hypothetical protein
MRLELLKVFEQIVSIVGEVYFVLAGCGDNGDTVLRLKRGEIFFGGVASLGRICKIQVHVVEKKSDESAGKRRRGRRGE